MSKIKGNIVNVMHTMRADEVIRKRDSVIEVFNLLNKLKMDYVIIEKKTLENHLMKKMKVSSEIVSFKMFNVKTNLSLEVNHIASESNLNYIIEKFPNYAVDEIEQYFDQEQENEK